MADIFKLLARSTKLQKNATSGSQPDARIPSAGIPTHPQLLADPAVLPEQQDIESKRGEKRKRKQAVVAVEEEEGVPDFFSTGGNTDARVVATRSRPTGDEATALVQPTKLDHVAVVAESLPLAERKTILKGHKLKVTLMGNEKAAKSKSTKKKAKAQTSQNKFEPVFPNPLLSFEELRARYSISKRLAENLEAQGYSTPTEVQLGSLPILLGDDKESGIAEVARSKKKNKSHIDLLTVAPTGSGKTLAFLIPIIQRLLDNVHQKDSKGEESKEGKDKDYVKAIVVAPTHELVDQIVNEAKKLAIGTGIKAAAMKKGMYVAQADDDAEMLATKNPVKADILVSTPLMLLHAITDDDTTPGNLPSVENLVLDEADVLLDPLFRDQTLGIWNSCSNKKLQATLWSATIGSSIEALAQDTITKRRELLGLSSSSRHTVRLIAGLKDSALPSISHKLVYAASEQGKLLAIRQLLHPSAGTDTEIAPLRPPFIVFTQTIDRATALHSELLYDIPIEAGGSARIAVLHSSLSDPARSAIMADFRRGEVWVIITTDLLARGIDFRGVNGVVNYDIPNTGAAYVHRAGRTGRAGREGGIAVTLYTKEDVPYVKNIANVIAASEKAGGKTGNGAVAGAGVQKWLLDALPDVSKKMKQELKKKGVEARRSTMSGGDKTKDERRSRISTKSGFDRKMENKRKGTIAASKRRMVEEDEDGGGDIVAKGTGSEDEWSGFE